MTTVSCVPYSEEIMDAFINNLKIYDQKDCEKIDKKTVGDINAIWSSIEDTTQYWKGNKVCQIPGEPFSRKDFWGELAKNRPLMHLSILDKFLKNNDVSEKTALDLGCGNSPAVNSLLQKGWSVTAIDYSQSALDVLRERIDEIYLDKIKFYCADILSGSPARPFNLVIATDILPYIDPKRFQKLWKKIHDVFLNNNGFLIGTLFRAAPTEKEIPYMNMAKEMGAWLLPDGRMAKTLLNETGYSIQDFHYRIDDPNSKPLCLEFLAQKNPSNS
jgi:2-polyprenyl-3-methyl-5-hydroxy-6-metoxy-1,4-benzoquinol methylase